MFLCANAVKQGPCILALLANEFKKNALLGFGPRGGNLLFELGVDHWVIHLLCKLDPASGQSVPYNI